jgi:adenylate cyclase
MVFNSRKFFRLRTSVGIEIERKFLLASERWRSLVQCSVHIQDGLVATSEDRKTRVRIIGDKATLAVKTGRVAGAREEFEYDIPMTDACRLMACCGSNVTVKMRHYVQHAGLTWEIDEYDGLLKGVILAEVELSAVDQHVDLPEWIGREVTEQPPYRKINMLRARQQLEEEVPGPEPVV